MTDPLSRSETRLALIRADIAEIHRILFGDGKGYEGLIYKVQRLLKNGRFIRRAALWCAAIIVIIATGIVQFKRVFWQILDR
jgi:hypothetical protein